MKCDYGADEIVADLPRRSGRVELGANSVSYGRDGFAEGKSSGEAKAARRICRAAARGAKKNAPMGR